MRATWAIVIATLTLGLVSRPMHGQTQAADAPPPETIHMVDAQSGWATLRDYHSGVSILARTASGGIQWEDVTPVDSTGHRIEIPYFHAFNSRFAWVEKVSLATTTEIFRTIDGGRTWKSAAIPAPSVTSISFINPREGWLIAFLVAALGANEFADIYRSTDGGETWSKVAMSSGLPYGVKRSITFLNSATGWITVLDPSGNQPYLYVTRDGGRTWRPQKMPLLRELTPRWEAWPEPPKFFSAREGSIAVRYDILSDAGERTGSVIVLYTTHDGWRYYVDVHCTPKGQRVRDDSPGSCRRESRVGIERRRASCHKRWWGTVDGDTCKSTPRRRCEADSVHLARSRMGGQER